MPAKSAKQYGLMQAAAHGNLRGTGGPSEGVAREFIKKTPSDVKSKFAHAIMKKKKSS